MFKKVLVVAMFLVMAVCVLGGDTFKVSYTNITGERHYTGLKPTTADKYKKFNMSVRYMGLAAIPTSYDLSSKMPPVGNQGNQGSCVAWATGYAYKSFQEGIDQQWGLTTPDHQFSPSFIYNQINGGSDQGSYIGDAMDLIKNKGVPPLSTMTYRDNDYTTKPNSYQLQVAANYKAKSWSAINYGDVGTIKSHIASGDPVVVGIPVYSDFENITASNPVYDNMSGTLLGYHAICLVGYDDSKSAFKFINSWGPTWGLKGYGYISYNIVSGQQIEAYVMEDVKTRVTPTPDPTPIPDPTPVPTTNLAIGKSCSASSYLTGYGPKYAFDADTSSSRWACSNGYSNTWITVDLGANYNVNRVKTKWSTSNYARNYTIYYIDSTGNWKAAKTVVGSGGDNDITFSAVNTRYVSISMINPNSSYYVIYDFAVYGLK